MATVTVELRNLLKTNFELFDFPYQFDDKAFAQELEQAVIDHYWNYEIGQETPDDFKRVFRRRWLQAVSYYNKLHNTTLLEYNPLINYKMNEALEQLSKTSRTEDSTTQANTDNTRTDNTQSTTDTNSKASDYPQQSIAGGNYLSGEQVTDSTIKNTGTVKDNSNATSSGATQTEGTDNTEYEKTIEGLTGTTYQELIRKERDNMLRITGMVIEELKPCFILVY